MRARGPVQGLPRAGGPGGIGRAGQVCRGSRQELRGQVEGCGPGRGRGAERSGAAGSPPERVAGGGWGAAGGAPLFLINALCGGLFCYGALVSIAAAKVYLRVPLIKNYS